MAKRAAEKHALITVASALAEANKGGDVGEVEVIECDEKGATLRVTFDEPRLSGSGNSYLVAYGRVKEGALTLVCTAYIPLGRDRAKPRPTNAGSRDEVSVPADVRAAERFYGRR